MISFDRLELLTSTKHIKGFDESKFQTVSMNGKLQYYRYTQKIPYVKIRIDYEKDELVIEFTSKISEYGFYNLINESTIYECLCSVPCLEFNGYVEDFIDDLEVLKCDVTKDVTFNDIRALKRFANSNLKNYEKWKCSNYPNGFILRNTASTQRHQRRLVIYNKGNELKLKRNKAFVDEVDNFDDGSFIEEYFREKVRFEMNIYTKEQIRKYLGIQDCNLMSVLKSDANPILTLLNEILKEPAVNNRVISTMKDYHCELTLKDCDYDLGKVEAKIRNLTSKNTSITKMMKPYRELHQRLQKNNTDPAFDLRKLVG